MGILAKLFGDKPANTNSKNILSQTEKSETHKISDYDATQPVKKRQQALKNNNDVTVLLNAYQTDKDELVIESADVRLREVLKNNACDSLLPQLKATNLSLKTCQELAAKAKSPIIRQTMLDKLHDDQVLSEVIAHSEDRAIQASAIAKVSEIDTLYMLIKRYKGKQKNLYRAAKDRLALMKKRQQHIEQLQQQFDTLGQSAVKQTLSRSAVISAEKRLNALVEDIPPKIYKQHSESLMALKTAANDIETAKDARHIVLTELSTVHTQLTNGAFTGSRKDFNALMNEQQQAWLKVHDWQSAEAKGMDIRFEQLLSKANSEACQYFDEKQHKHAQSKILSQCQRWLQKNTFVTANMIVDQEKRWQSLPPLAEPVEQKMAQSEFESLIAQLHEKSNQQVTAQSDNDTVVPKLIEDFAVALENGKVKEAQKFQTQIRDRLKNEACLSKTVHQDVCGRFKRLENRLTELKKWQHFGDDQVRQNLIDTMQKLSADDTLEILDKAEQIRSIQEQWKALKGYAAQALWAQFKVIGDEAWEPCAEYFKSVRNTSKDLLKQRMDFLSEAQQHLDTINWDTPNWKALGTAHRKFEQMWRDFPKLQDKEYHKAKKAYDALVGQWDKNLDDERFREKVRREGLIQQAEAQIGNEDTQVATSIIKDLQSQWTPTLGLKRRNAEQALWERFRATCDAVFAEHNKQRDASRQASNSAFESHQKYLDDIASLFDSENDFDRLQTRFNESMQALPDFDDVPEKAQRALRAQINKLTTKLDKQQNIALLDKRILYLAQMNDQDLLCIQIEQDKLPSDRLGTLANKWHSIEPLMSDGQNIMRKRFEKALERQEQNKFVKNDENTVSEAQEICLLLEMTANLPSPEFAADAREQMRLKILNDAMNGDKSFERLTTEAGIYDITVRWRTLPKGALNIDDSGDSLVNWRARFDTSVQEIRTNNQIKQSSENNDKP